MSSDLLQQALGGSTLVVAIDPGKVQHRVWFSTGDAELLEEPRSVPSLRPGLEDVAATIRRLAGAAPPVVAIEATGTTVTVIELDTGEVLATNTIDPTQTYWRNTQKAPGRWPGTP